MAILKQAVEHGIGNRWFGQSMLAWGGEYKRRMERAEDKPEVVTIDKAQLAIDRMAKAIKLREAEQAAEATA